MQQPHALHLLGIGAAADLLRVPAAAAGRDGAAQRSDRAVAETAALLALMRGHRCSPEGRRRSVF